MALFARNMGWVVNELTGVTEFRITLIAETETDVPKLTFSTVLEKRNLTLSESQS